MVKPDEVLEPLIREFHARYAPLVLELAALLDEAGISHYSAGGGTYSVTFDIFPASAYAAELLNLLSLSRPHRTRPENGFRDASSSREHNPANEFMLYLRRWTHFAEQVMQREGDGPRGIAAARAKLLMADLASRMAYATPREKTGLRSGPPPVSDFARLMRLIGLTLEARTRLSAEGRKTNTSEAQQRNYQKAMAAAQSLAPADASAHQAA